jgi:imidazolonepropionase-like amidohydrolase
MTAIINATLVMRDHFIPDAVLFVEDGKIAGYGEMRKTPVPEGCEIIDAEGLYVGPGFVDIHTHMKHISGDRFGFEPHLFTVPFGVTAAADCGGNMGFCFCGGAVALHSKGRYALYSLFCGALHAA